jgi:hypothetical protein
VGAEVNEPENEAEAVAEVKEAEKEAGPDGREALIIEEIVSKGAMRRQTTTESEVEMAAQFRPARTVPAGNGETGLATIIGLAQWATRTTKQLGAERIKIILEISEMMGHLTPDTKQILTKLIDITPDGYAGEVSTRDYMVALIELANLLGKVGESEAILYSILYQKERAELLV